jgi:hypothetical protein
MNIDNPSDQEVDEFFEWLQTLKPASPAIETQPTEEMLDLAWQAAQAHRGAFGNNAYCETIMPLAASDGSHKDGPLRFDLLGGDWSLEHQIIPQDPDWQILRITCRQELIADNTGRTIKIQVGDLSIDLGKLNQHGVAEAEVPSGIDFGQETFIYFSERKQPE